MRKEKQLLLDDIQRRFSGSKGFIVTRYSKMDPNLAARLRFDVLRSGGDFEVVRKRVLIKAADAVGVALDRASLGGHIGVIFSMEDPLKTAKVVCTFAETHAEVLDIISGTFEGTLYTAQEVQALSKLPSKPEMQAQLLATFEAVPSQLLAVMEALLSKQSESLENKQET